MSSTYHSIADVPVEMEKLRSVQLLRMSPMHHHHVPVYAGTSPLLTTIWKPALMTSLNSTRYGLTSWPLLKVSRNLGANSKRGTLFYSKEYFPLETIVKSRDFRHFYIADKAFGTFRAPAYARSKTFYILSCLRTRVRRLLKIF